MIAKILGIFYDINNETEQKTLRIKKEDDDDEKKYERMVSELHQ